MVYKTDRLVVRKASIRDAEFIAEIQTNKYKNISGVLSNHKRVTEVGLVCCIHNSIPGSVVH